jgi:ferredoxin
MMMSYKQLNLPKNDSSQKVTHRVTFVNESEGLLTTISVPENEYILDAATSNGVNLPSACRVGACSYCAGHLEVGSVDQSTQTFLDDDQIAAGYILLCRAYATSDCTIMTHKEKELAA